MEKKKLGKKFLWIGVLFLFIAVIGYYFFTPRVIVFEDQFNWWGLISEIPGLIGIILLISGIVLILTKEKLPK